MPFLALRIIFAFFLDVVAVLTHSDHDQTMELLLLRQQLRLYERRAKQPRASRWEKVVLATLAAQLPDLSRGALVFTPATLLRWHRDLVRRTWTFDNTPKPGRPATPAARIALILRLARENPTWGYGKIQGELLKLGHRALESTIKRLLRQHGLPPVPERGRSTWRDFLGHYRVHLAGCTATPDAAWVTQQARQFTWALQEADALLRFLIHDRDAKFPPSCDTVFADEGVEVTRTPYQSPTANAYAERWVRSVRAADRDHRMIGGAGHLRRVLAEYVAHSNEARPHQGLDQRCPIPPTAMPSLGAVRRRERLGGVRHDYDREAA